MWQSVGGAHAGRILVLSPISPDRVVDAADRTPHMEMARMNQDILSESFFEALVGGDRARARLIVKQFAAIVGSPQRVIEELVWPTYESIDKLFRADQLSRIAHQFATRLLRVLAEHLSGQLQRSLANGTRVVAFCGASESDELAAQIAVDTLEASGYTVSFAGGGVPSDEIVAHVHEARPDVLLLFASAAADLPGVRTIIQTLRTINGSPNTKIAVGGGVFNRAPGLAEELEADMYASTPLELAQGLSGKGRKAPAMVEAAAPARTKRRLKAA